MPLSVLKKMKISTSLENTPDSKVLVLILSFSLMSKTIKFEIYWNVR